VNFSFSNYGDMKHWRQRSGVN